MKIYTETERQEHIERWEKGTLSKAGYAKSAGIHPTTFYTWVRGKTDVGKQSLVEIPKKKLVVSSGSLTIEKGNMTVHVPLGAGVKDLQTVFAALGEPK